MSFFDSLTKKLFPASHKRQPLVHEVLTRSAKAQAEHQLWLAQPGLNELLQDIHRAYFLMKTNVRGALQVHLLQMNAANGFALTYHSSLGKDGLRHLADYLKDRMLANGYRLQNRDRLMAEKGNFVQTTEKYYCKPINKAQQKKMEQRYGNVLIEAVYIDDKPSFLKVQANIYSDQLFNDPLPFDDLVDYLLVS